MRLIFAISILVIDLNFSIGQQFTQDSLRSQELHSITISSFRNNYKTDSSFSVARLPLKDIENPQVYLTISKSVIKDQVITNLNNALKNATGVSRLWESTGRGGDGAEFYSMRGFAMQPNLVNGLSSISNGTIDPANIENIELIKGPSGTLFGGSIISYGGLINIVTKKPFENFGGEIGFIAGGYGLNRYSADINTPLSNRVFARINAAYHYEKSFQDAGYTKSFYFAPSFKILSNKKLSFYLNSEFKNATAVNAPMIFLNRYAPLSFQTLDLFEKNYNKSYTNNSLLMNNPSYSIQLQAMYTLSRNWISQTLISRSHTRTNGYYHYLWDASNGDEFTRFISKRNGETATSNIQQNFIGSYKLGNTSNKVVVGLDYLQSQIENYSTGWVDNGKVSLQHQTDSGLLSTQGVDALLINSSEANAVAKTQISSAYISDVIYFTSKISSMFSLRVDHFSGKPVYWTDSEIKSQTSLSPKFGLVYQPILNKLSLFANYLNGFTNLAPVQVSDAQGNNPSLKILKPEHANQWELGTKANIAQNKISVTASYYYILVSNKAMSDPQNINNTIQGGEVESKGFEISLVSNPIHGLSLLTGFSHNDNKVTKDAVDNGYLGLRTEEAGPATLFNFWANYRLAFEKLKGLSVGFGMNYAGEHKTLNRSNTGTFVLPRYYILNGLISYSADNFSFNLKLDNIANTHYYNGWSTVSAQKLRSLSLGCTFKF